jgi:hypothetical protein
MQFRNEQILTKKDGDRFHGGVVKDEIIELARRNRRGMSEPEGRLASCQTAGPRVGGGDHVDWSVPGRQVTLRREIAIVCKLAV